MKYKMKLILWSIHKRYSQYPQCQSLPVHSVCHQHTISASMAKHKVYCRSNQTPLHQMASRVQMVFSNVFYWNFDVKFVAISDQFNIYLMWWLGADQKAYYCLNNDDYHFCKLFHLLLVPLFIRYHLRENIWNCLCKISLPAVAHFDTKYGWNEHHLATLERN